MLPRLAGLWTHLSKQKGGIGLKGAGEKEIETDRRIIRDKISRHKKKLVEIEKQEINRRKNRSEFVRVSLVGYTNVGKSTLMNLLSKSTVLEEDKLFATLDTTVRKVFFGQMPFLLSDTVGLSGNFLTTWWSHFGVHWQKPRSPIFSSMWLTLPILKFEDQIKVVKETLGDIGVTDKTVITVFNKFDLLDEDAQKHIHDSYYGKENMPAVFISAIKKQGIDKLRKMIFQTVWDSYKSRPNQKAYYFLNEYNFYDENGKLMV